MIAFDTNLLVYAHRAENPWHESARDILIKVAESGNSWAIPWSCIHEFLNIVTNPRIFQTPTPPDTAIQFIQDLRQSADLRLLSESEGYFEILADLICKGRIRGPLVHDTRIVANCLLHGVRVLYSADRDFGRFPDLPVQNPLVDS